MLCKVKGKFFTKKHMSNMDNKETSHYVIRLESTSFFEGGLGFITKEN